MPISMNTGICNIGSFNDGSFNIGNHNSGSYNIGHHNTGNWNIGDHNTGNWNIGDHNDGYFNTGHQLSPDPNKIKVFNGLLVDRYDFLEVCPRWLTKVRYTEWIPTEQMSEEEKIAHPKRMTQGGYLRHYDAKAAWAAAWAAAYDTATDAGIQAVRDLPGFDATIFQEITGLDLNENKFILKSDQSEPKPEIVIDGVTYILKK